MSINRQIDYDDDDDCFYAQTYDATIVLMRARARFVRASLKINNIQFYNELLVITRALCALCERLYMCIDTNTHTRVRTHSSLDIWVV